VLIVNWTLLLYAGRVNGFESMLGHFCGVKHKRRMKNSDCFSSRTAAAHNYSIALRDGDVCILYEDFFAEPGDMVGVRKASQLPHKDRTGRVSDSELISAISWDHHRDRGTIINHRGQAGWWDHHPSPELQQITCP